MTDWESRYQTGDTPWDKGAPAPPLIEWLAKTTALPTGRVLVPGSGLGHDVRALTAACPAADVLGLDLAQSAVDRAAALGGQYQLGDLFKLPASMRKAFDWVFEHTCFCAIDPAQRGDYAAAVAQALKPGGHLLAIFYLNPQDPGEDATGPPHGVTLAELDARFASAFELIEDGVPSQAYPGREGRERLRLYRKRANSGV